MKLYEVQPALGNAHRIPSAYFLSDKPAGSVVGYSGLSMTAVYLRLIPKNTFPEVEWSEAQFTNEETQ